MAVYGKEELDEWILLSVDEVRQNDVVGGSKAYQP